jgi:DNA-binding Lrp family transcriptional regulator
LLLFVVVSSNGTQILDALDRQIAVALQANGRASWRAIARCLDTPERTVTRRGQAMLDSGVVKVSTYLDTTRVGRARPLIIVAHTEPGRSVEIGHQIAKRGDASSVSVLEGTGNLVCMLLPSDGESRYRLLLSELPSLEGVRDTSVATVLRYFRAGYDWSAGGLPDSALQALDRLGIRFEFDGGPAVHAPLHEKQAPNSTRVLWEALSVPVTMLATHAMYAGPEIMLNLPEEARTFSPGGHSRREPAGDPDGR